MFEVSTVGRHNSRERGTARPQRSSDVAILGCQLRGLQLLRELELCLSCELQEAKPRLNVLHFSVHSVQG
jgi:hypothetical protein